MARSGKSSHRRPSHRPTRTSDAIVRIDSACRRAVAGKLAMRDIAAWVRAFDVGETEFRLLWLLQDGAGESLETPNVDQSRLAQQLAVSPAQVSSLVERLQSRGLLEHQSCEDDRRRQLWQLSAAGYALIDGVVAALARSVLAKEAA